MTDAGVFATEVGCWGEAVWDASSAHSPPSARECRSCCGHPTPVGGQKSHGPGTAPQAVFVPAASRATPAEAPHPACPPRGCWRRPAPTLGDRRPRPGPRRLAQATTSCVARGVRGTDGIPARNGDFLPVHPDLGLGTLPAGGSAGLTKRSTGVRVASPNLRELGLDGSVHASKTPASLSQQGLVPDQRRPAKEHSGWKHRRQSGVRRGGGSSGMKNSPWFSAAFERGRSSPASRWRRPRSAWWSWWSRRAGHAPSASCRHPRRK